MTEQPQPFIALPAEEEIRARMPPGKKLPYDFGFIPAMARLLSAHERIGTAVRAAFYEIMFAPGTLDRAEREMIAAVASAAQGCEF